MTLRISGFRTTADARPFDWELAARERVAVVGPAASGKSRFMSAWNGPHVLRPTIKPKATPMSVAKTGGSDWAAEILSVLRLWDVRRDPIVALSPGQRAACEVIEVLARDGIPVFDGTLDHLDAWVLPEVLARLPSPVGFATCRPDLAETADRLTVLGTRGLLFDGPPAEFIRQLAPHELEVETAEPTAVRAMVEPFALEIRAEGHLLRIRVRDGQSLAARLCLEGYAQVRAIVLRTPTLAEALRDLHA